MTKFNAAFWKWFGDSKIVDSKGLPLVVYHGSSSSFDRFDLVLAGQLDTGWSGTGFYFARDPETASVYATRGGDDLINSQIYPVYLSIKNPLVDKDLIYQLKKKSSRTGRLSTKADSDSFTEIVKNEGYDGVIVGAGVTQEIVAFYPEQIKSATGNDGTWDADDPKIASNPPKDEKQFASEHGVPYHDYDAELYSGFVQKYGPPSALSFSFPRKFGDEAFLFVDEDNNGAPVAVMGASIMSNPAALLFSYGSNHPAQLSERLGHEIAGVPATLSGYRRVFRGFSQKWQGGVASLAKVAGGTVYGYVAPVSENDLNVLDRYEGVASGKYVRKKVKVTVADDLVEAIAYVSTSTEFNEPTREYLEACAKTVGAFWSGSGGRVTWRDFKIS